MKNKKFYHNILLRWQNEVKKNIILLKSRKKLSCEINYYRYPNSTFLVTMSDYKQHQPSISGVRIEPILDEPSSISSRYRPLRLNLNSNKTDNENKDTRANSESKEGSGNIVKIEEISNEKLSSETSPTLSLAGSVSSIDSPSGMKYSSGEIKDNSPKGVGDHKDSGAYKLESIDEHDRIRNNSSYISDIKESPSQDESFGHEAAWNKLIPTLSTIKSVSSDSTNNSAIAADVSLNSAASTIASASGNQLALKEKFLAERRAIRQKERERRSLATNESNSALLSESESPSGSLTGSPLIGKTGEQYQDIAEKIDSQNDVLMNLQRKKVWSQSHNAKLELEVEALQRQLAQLERMDKELEIQNPSRVMLKNRTAVDRNQLSSEASSSQIPTSHIPRYINNTNAQISGMNPSRRGKQQSAFLYGESVHDLSNEWPHQQKNSRIPALGGGGMQSVNAAIAAASAAAAAVSSTAAGHKSGVARRKRAVGQNKGDLSPRIPSNLSVAGGDLAGLNGQALVAAEGNGLARLPKGGRRAAGGGNISASNFGVHSNGRIGAARNDLSMLADVGEEEEYNFQPGRPTYRPAGAPLGSIFANSEANSASSNNSNDISFSSVNGYHSNANASDMINEKKMRRQRLRRRTAEEMESLYQIAAEKATLTDNTDNTDSPKFRPNAITNPQKNKLSSRNSSVAAVSAHAGEQSPRTKISSTISTLRSRNDPAGNSKLCPFDATQSETDVVAQSSVYTQSDDGYSSVDNDNDSAIESDGGGGAGGSGGLESAKSRRERGRNMLKMFNKRRHTLIGRIDELSDGMEGARELHCEANASEDESKFAAIAIAKKGPSYGNGYGRFGRGSTDGNSTTDDEGADNNNIGSSDSPISNTVVKKDKGTLGAGVERKIGKRRQGGLSVHSHVPVLPVSSGDDHHGGGEDKEIIIQMVSPRPGPFDKIAESREENKVNGSNVNVVHGVRNKGGFIDALTPEMLQEILDAPIDNENFTVEGGDDKKSSDVPEKITNAEASKSSAAVGVAPRAGRHRAIGTKLRGAPKGAREKKSKLTPATSALAVESASSSSGPWTQVLDSLWCEVELLLRRPIQCPEDLMFCEASAEAGLLFMHEMDEVSKSLQILRGALSRWLLPYDNNTRIDEQSSTPHSVVENMPDNLRGKLTERQVHYLVKGANNVRKLVRIKIADDNDLEQARTALKTAAEFFKKLNIQAASVNMSSFDLLSTQLNVNS